VVYGEFQVAIASLFFFEKILDFPHSEAGRKEKKMCVELSDVAGES